jgi:hypothetical protein
MKTEYLIEKIGQDAIKMLLTKIKLMVIQQTILQMFFLIWIRLKL